MNKRDIHISPSSMSTIKSCPVEYQYKYEEGIRVDGSTASQWDGTTWGAMHEVYRNTYTEAREHEGGLSNEDCDEAALSAVWDYVNERYSGELPTWRTPEEWVVNRVIMTTSFLAYLWYYQDDEIVYLASEFRLRLPVYMNGDGIAVPGAVRVGRLDHLALWQQTCGPIERKSTSLPIEAGSDYWLRLDKDDQVSFYAAGIREMAASGDLPPLPDGVSKAKLGNTIYDVWHKPSIKPTTLTQAATAELIETGKYYDTDYRIDSVPTITVEGKGKEKTVSHEGIVVIDGDDVEFEVGKSGKLAIRETPGMFGARLMADIQERPEFYFARREIPRTDKQLAAHRREVWQVYQTIRHFQKTGAWYENGKSCYSPFRCDYIPLCHGGGGAANFCDGKTTPIGFKRIYTPLTVEGE